MYIVYFACIELVQQYSTANENLHHRLPPLYRRPHLLLLQVLRRFNTHNHRHHQETPSSLEAQRFIFLHRLLATPLMGPRLIGSTRQRNRPNSSLPNSRFLSPRTSVVPPLSISRLSLPSLAGKFDGGGGNFMWVVSFRGFG